MIKRLLPLIVVLAGMPAGAVHACDWPMYGHDKAHSFAQTAACSRIDAGNVASLGPKWFFHTEDSVTASPIVLDGIVYVGSWDGTFYALDAEDGSEYWQFTIDDEHEVAFGRIVSTAWAGTILVKGPGGGTESKRVILLAGGATLYALEASADGPNLLAKIDVDPRTPAKRAADDAAGKHPQVEIESSPVVGRFPDGDRIFVGMDVHNAKDVGRSGLLSFELHRSASGYFFALKYKFDPESGVPLSSLTEGSGTGLGCGGVWSSPVVHETALGPGDGVVVFGTANCTSPSDSPVRESMYGLVAKTGQLLWKYTPPRPADFDPDQDFGASPNLLSNSVVGEGSKDGWYYARNLVNGSEVWSQQIAQPGQADEGFSVGGFIGSTAMGSVNGEPAIFGATAIPTPVNQTSDGFDTSFVDRPQQLFSLHAFSAATGQPLWDNPLTLPSYGAVTYTNGLLFVPDTFGFQLQVVDANTGLLLRAQPTPGAPSSAPAIVEDSVYLGIGTRETDAEWKAFGNEIGDLFEGTVGAHPLSPLSGVVALSIPT